jgi:predicted MFS family arabinose efflux permease
MFTQYLGWRSIFLISGSLSVFTTLIAFLFLGKDEAELPVNRKIDLKGTLFYMAGLVAMVFGSARIPSTAGWILMGSGLFLLVTFWMLEKRSSMPVIETRLFTHNRLFAFSNLAALINYSATFAIVFLLSLYLQKVRGLNPRDAGTILIAQPVVMALLSPVTGRLSDRIQPRYLTSLGMTCCTLGLGSFALLTDATPIWLIIVQLAGVGLGFALFSSPNMNTIMRSGFRNRFHHEGTGADCKHDHRHALLFGDFREAYHRRSSRSTFHESHEVGIHGFCADQCSWDLFLMEPWKSQPGAWLSPSLFIHRKG